MLEGVVPFPPEFARRYRQKGYWRDRSLAEEFAAVFRQFAARTAFVDRDTQVSYAQVDRASDRLALNLLDAGLRPLDRVVVQLPNVIEFVYLDIALPKIGATLAVKNASLFAPSVIHCLTFASSSAVTRSI